MQLLRSAHATLDAVPGGRPSRAACAPCRAGTLGAAQWSGGAWCPSTRTRDPVQGRWATVPDNTQAHFRDCGIWSFPPTGQNTVEVTAHSTDFSTVPPLEVVHAIAV